MIFPMLSSRDCGEPTVIHNSQQLSCSPWVTDIVPLGLFHVEAHLGLRCNV